MESGAIQNSKSTFAQKGKADEDAYIRYLPYRTLWTYNCGHSIMRSHITRSLNCRKPNFLVVFLLFATFHENLKVNGKKGHVYSQKGDHITYDLKMQYGAFVL